MRFHVEDASANIAQTMWKRQTTVLEKQKNLASCAMSADGSTEIRSARICGDRNVKASS